MRSHIKKLAKKLKLKEKEIIDIIVWNHAYKYYYKKNELKEVDLNLAGDSLKIINNISKTLEVSKDAVITHAITNYIEQENERKNQKT